MEVYRIVQSQYAVRLQASGKAARWNREGEFVLYTSSSRSLATLELLVHNRNLSENKYEVLVISVPDEDLWYRQIRSDELSENWRSMMSLSETRMMGSGWYQAKNSLLLKIPSAVIVNEFNFLVNTLHGDFASRVKLVRREPFYKDVRIIE